MKKYLIWGLAALCLAAVSCENNVDSVEQDLEGMYTLTATIGAETRSEGSKGGDFTWSEDDAISVFTSSNGFRTFAINPEDAGGETATFTARLPAEESVGGYAVYPACEDHRMSGTDLIVNLPSVYGSSDKPYSRSTNAVMVAEASGEANPGDLVFHHAGGCLRFDIASVPEGTAKFVFKTKAVIAGEFTVNFSDPDSNDHPEQQTPLINAGTSDSENQITLLFSPFTAPQDEVFYIPLPAGTYKGFTIELQNADGTVIASMTETKERTLNRRRLVNYYDLVYVPDQFLYRYAFELGEDQQDAWVAVKQDPKDEEDNPDQYLAPSISSDDMLACQRIGYVPHADC